MWIYIANNNKDLFFRIQNYINSLFNNEERESEAGQ